MPLPSNTNWTFKKEVSIGDLVAITVAIGGVLSAYFTLRNEIELIKARVLTTEIASDGIKQDINSRLNRIEDKLDRAIERTTTK